MANVFDVASLFVDLSQAQAECGMGDLMTNLRLQKMLYFAQGWHLARFGVPLFDDDLCAWTYGPVVKCVYDQYRCCGRNGIEMDTISDLDERFTPEEFALLLDVAREYDGVNTSKLVQLSHANGSPWCQTQKGEAISKQRIRDYFASLPPLMPFDASALGLEIIEPKRDENGTAVFPAELAEEWEW